ncbi:MAG: tetratricopeptide repeat protein [Acidimicrobiia bacterium]
MSDREELEAERDFLLESLDDLEIEHESGGIDDESYRELHDDYTARAAATIRALRDGVDARPSPAPPVAARRRIAIIAVIVVFAVVAGVALASALGARLPGQTASGNSQSAQEDAAAKRLSRTIKTLEAKVNASPDDYDARLGLAHAYEANGDLRNALAQSDNAITIDPNRPQAHANAGRLLYLASEAIKDNDTRVQFVTEASAALDTALEKDPEYADAYYFRSVLESATSQLDRAQADLQTYLVKAPNGPYADGARDLLARVTRALESPSTTVPDSP